MTKRIILATIVLSLAASMVSAQTQATQTPAKRAQPPLTVRVLNQRIPAVEFVEQPFSQVMDWLADLTQLNIVVRWQTLEDAGIDRDKPISMKVRNIRLSQVLWLLMNDLGGSEIKLAYRAEGSMLVLSTADDLGQEMITKVYDISDLLIHLPRASRAAAFDVTQGLGQNTGGTGGGSGGSGSGMFGQGGQQNQQGQNDQENQGAQAELDTLVDLIQQTVVPDSWTVNGGRGQIFPFRNLLIVYNTVLVHQQLGGPVTDDTRTGP